MTVLIEGVKVLTYEEWVEKRDVQDLLTDIEDCDTCGGTGEHECECGHVHECLECEGKGTVTDIRDVYESILRDEINKLIAWRDGLAVKHISSLGDQQDDTVNTVKIKIHGNA